MVVYEICSALVRTLQEISPRVLKSCGDPGWDCEGGSSQHGH